MENKIANKTEVKKISRWPSLFENYGRVKKVDSHTITEQDLQPPKLPPRTNSYRLEPESINLNNSLETQSEPEDSQSRVNPTVPKRRRKRDIIWDGYKARPGMYNKRILTKKQAQQRIQFIKTYAQWLDRIPGCPIPVGIDSIIGLVPGVGDVSAAGLSLLLIYLARDLDMPQPLFNKMFRNVALETVIGSVPLVGDAFDFWFAANLRNLKVIEQWFLKNQNRFQGSLDEDLAEANSD